MWGPDPAVGQPVLPLKDQRTRPARDLVPTRPPRAILMEAGDVLYMPRVRPPRQSDPAGRATVQHLVETYVSVCHTVYVSMTPYTPVHSSPAFCNPSMALN